MISATLNSAQITWNWTKRTVSARINGTGVILSALNSLDS